MSNKEISHTTKEPMRYQRELLNWRFTVLEKERGFSMEEWARLAKLTGPTIKRIRLGENVSIDTLTAAALAIDINPEFLLLKKDFQFRRAVLNGNSAGRR